ncbi:hypothetical protein [Baekduia sp. Peel2402]|uniref:hypothetical protein n=1 Tax=Baekduia sp. Peel2402 TaxID=3458296 RepID=UPI00403E66B9
MTLDTSRLAPLPLAFFSGLVALLDALAPPLLDVAMTKATPRGDGVEVVLAHASEIAFSVWAQASGEVVVVGCSAMHSEFADAAAALALVEELLRGRREVRGYDGVVLRPDFVGVPPRA